MLNGKKFFYTGKDVLISKDNSGYSVHLIDNYRGKEIGTGNEHADFKDISNYLAKSPERFFSRGTLVRFYEKQKSRISATERRLIFSLINIIQDYRREKLILHRLDIKARKTLEKQKEAIEKLGALEEKASQA